MFTFQNRLNIKSKHEQQQLFRSSSSFRYDQENYKKILSYEEKLTLFSSQNSLSNSISNLNNLILPEIDNNCNQSKLFERKAKIFYLLYRLQVLKPIIIYLFENNINMEISEELIVIYQIIFSFQFRNKFIDKEQGQKDRSVYFYLRE